MMRFARKAALLVPFSLFTSTATAYAECAWVLWTRGASAGPGSSMRSFGQLITY
jgi:hypothetical protein